MTVNAAIKYRTAGIGIWDWMRNEKGGESDVVMACAGEVPTLDNLAAADFLRK